jgi:hypothetical protein
MSNDAGLDRAAIEDRAEDARNSGDPASHSASAADVPAASLIERDARRAERQEPFAWKHVAWLGPYGVVPGGLDVEPAPHWRRLYVMLTAEERAAIHGVQVGELP